MGRDVIIACDFNSKEEVINFLGKIQRGKTFCKNRHGAVLCRGTGDRPHDQTDGTQDFP